MIAARTEAMKLFLKTLSYGMTHIVVATTIAYILTGNLAAAVGIGLIEPVVQTGVFALHDWLWERGDGHDLTQAGMVG
jgi:uncharacterized membrane protein